MSETLKKPTKKEQESARKSASSLKEIIFTFKTSDELLIRIEGESISIPRTAVELLEKVLDQMSKGNFVEISSVSEDLTTQEAADLLKVSRPHLVKLLETGKIPHKMVGTHRRVKRTDVLNYESDLKEIRRRNLEILANEAQEMKLGYE
ncbi:helix-turn-helix domain-containing protein [Algoriphagus marinus]|uniref:helix-turn-helix domain-containing protein n=1 Tax=Algoriphagus marinus TaxID=1925762 RepID=UPI00094BA63C|nr:helix-turn-helix domain-containing protein [Algoriphagus marinus]